jgi:hypothetical protein
VHFYTSDLQSEVSGQASLAGATALVQPSFGVSARLGGGQLRVGTFDAVAPVGAIQSLQLGDPAAHGLALAAFEPGYALATWVGGDGRARAAEISTIHAPVGFSDIFTLCGPGGVQQAYPINGNQVVLLEGDSLAVRAFR